MLPADHLTKLPYTEFFVSQLLLLISFVMNDFNLASAKPDLLENASPEEQSDDLISQPQRHASEREQRSSQESDAPREEDETLENKTAYNHTTRNKAHPCISHLLRTFDRCRNSFVTKVHCEKRHMACIQAIPKYSFPKCQTVFGFYKAKFIKKCAPLPIDCKCAD